MMEGFTLSVYHDFRRFSRFGAGLDLTIKPVFDICIQIVGCGSLVAV